MANTKYPGSGYKRGSETQEEALFRRSNYFQSLDLELHDGKPTARFYCNSNCELESLAEHGTLDPMDEFGAIYTLGLTVFRQPENTGYAFVEIPVYDVCAIVMSHYRDSKVENNLLTSKYSIGQNLNPIEKFRPFQKLLDTLDKEPKRHKLVDMMIGSWRILNQTTMKITLSDIRIFHLNLCLYGEKCNELKNEQHSREYSHPPLCPYAHNMTPCKHKDDSQHMLWFRHPQKCSYGSKCELIENDLRHSNEFEHPEFCPDRGRCENMNNEHRTIYQHVPLYKFHRQCVNNIHGLNDHYLSFCH
ncbi:unnamed protein product [Rotaria sp. Silwood1]|nr:unnamed protein product [Rotaria sp. Silwood1]